MIRSLGALLVLGLGFAGGCVLFTGGTDGYSLTEAGAAASCTSASSCQDGSVCCLVVTTASTSTAGTCSASCANPSYPQLCTTNAECGDGGPCAKLTCAVDAGGGLSVPIQACGTVMGCVASP